MFEWELVSKADLTIKYEYLSLRSHYWPESGENPKTVL